MNNKVQELTETIFREGVEKGEQQARVIIAEAEKKAAAMLDCARAEAAQIAEQAKKSADELRQSAEADLRLAVSQALSALKQQILDIVTATVVDKPVTQSLADPETVTEFLKIILGNWNPASGGMSGIEVLLPESRREELSAALEEGLRQELAAGVRLQFGKNIKTGMQLRPQGASYKISLTDEDFQEYFKQYLRPKMRSFLFREN
jgi:V/A-type H+-transporting ATPase subunit E